MAVELPPRGVPAAPGTWPAFGDLEALLERFKALGVPAVVESEPVQALAEANRQPWEGLAALAEHRGEILRDALAQWQDALREAGGELDLAGTGLRAMHERFQQSLAHLQRLLRPR